MSVSEDKTPFKIASKPAPEAGELEDFSRFSDYAEIYLKQRHLDNFPESLLSIRQADIEPVTVHTTHEALEDEGPEYFRRADTLANSLDATLVFHSKNIPMSKLSDVRDEIDFVSDVAYENQAGASDSIIKNTVLDQGFDYIEDVAHTFLAYPDSYLDIIESRLNDYPDQVKAVHFNDAGLPDDDGRAIGAGDMDMEAVYRRVAESEYSGPLVVEVDPGHQRQGIEKVENWMSEFSGEQEAVLEAE